MQRPGERHLTQAPAERPREFYLIRPVPLSDRLLHAGFHGAPGCCRLGYPPSVRAGGANLVSTPAQGPGRDGSGWLQARGQEAFLTAAASANGADEGGVSRRRVREACDSRGRLGVCVCLVGQLVHTCEHAMKRLCRDLAGTGGAIRQDVARDSEVRLAKPALSRPIGVVPRPVPCCADRETGDPR